MECVEPSLAYVACTDPETSLPSLYPCLAAYLDEARDGVGALDKERLGQGLKVLPPVLVRKQPAGAAVYGECGGVGV